MKAQPTIRKCVDVHWSNIPASMSKVHYTDSKTNPTDNIQIGNVMSLVIIPTIGSAPWPGTDDELKDSGSEKTPYQWHPKPALDTTGAYHQFEVNLPKLHRFVILGLARGWLILVGVLAQRHFSKEDVSPIRAN